MGIESEFIKHALAQCPGAIITAAMPIALDRTNVIITDVNCSIRLFPSDKPETMHALFMRVVGKKMEQASVGTWNEVIFVADIPQLVAECGMKAPTHEKRRKRLRAEDAYPSNSCFVENGRIYDAGSDSFSDTFDCHRVMSTSNMVKQLYSILTEMVIGEAPHYMKLKMTLPSFPVLTWDCMHDQLTVFDTSTLDPLKTTRSSRTPALGEADTCIMQYLRRILSTADGRARDVFIDTVDGDLMVLGLHHMHDVDPFGTNRVYVRKRGSPGSTDSVFYDLRAIEMFIVERQRLSTQIFMSLAILCGTDFFEKKWFTHRIGMKALVRYVIHDSSSVASSSNDDGSSSSSLVVRNERNPDKFIEWLRDGHVRRDLGATVSLMKDYLGSSSDLCCSTAEDLDRLTAYITAFDKNLVYWCTLTTP